MRRTDQYTEYVYEIRVLQYFLNKEPQQHLSILVLLTLLYITYRSMTSTRTCVVLNSTLVIRTSSNRGGLPGAALGASAGGEEDATGGVGADHPRTEPSPGRDSFDPRRRSDASPESGRAAGGVGNRAGVGLLPDCRRKSFANGTHQDRPSSPRQVSYGKIIVFLWNLPAC